MSREGIIITKNKYNLVYITKEWNIWMNVRNRGIAFFQFLFLDSFFIYCLKIMYKFNCMNSYFLSIKVLFFCFLLAVVVSVSKNSCIEIFFNKFKSNIEKFEANGREFFNITWEGSNNSEEKQKNKTLVERDITFLYHCWVFLSIRTIG